MSTSPIRFLRVLAIDPISWGFGYVIVEQPEQLIDFGIKVVNGNKNRQRLAHIAELIDNFHPDIIVVEDTTKKGSRRRKRARQLIQEIIKLAQTQKIKYCAVSRLEVLALFSQFGATTKHQIAVSIAGLFTEMASDLPSYRKDWMPEDRRTSMFDATAFALTYFSRIKNKTRNKSRKKRSI